MRTRTPIARTRKATRKTRRRFERPSWLWKWHQLLSVFVLFLGVGMVLASVQYGAKKFPAYASAGDNVMGWLWADPVGWVSLNSANASACSPGPCGSYGVNVDPTTRNMNGFAWDDDAGWICFGDSCSVAACNGTTPGGPLEAHLNPISGVTAVHGWAKVCNEGSGGWISLNCAEPGVCGAYAYKVQYDPSTKKFTPNTPPPYNSLAWNGNSNGTGFGYIDFSHAYLNTPAENSVAGACKDTSDNDLNGSADCLDSACHTDPSCKQAPGVTDTGGNPTCHNGIDDDGTGIDCASPNCKTDPTCVQNPSNNNAVLPGYSLSGVPVCGDGIDNDGTGIDCASPGCAGYVGPPGGSCAPPPPPSGSETACTNPNPPFAPLGAAVCCSNGIDDDGNGVKDCNDASCQATVAACVPAWLQTKFGNIYAQAGLTASSSPFIAGQSATYCLSTQGSISGFTSQAGCTESGSQAQAIVLPKGTQNYQGTLGSLDINGIRQGRYGTVQRLAAGPLALPSFLAGKVYLVPGNATLSATTFLNGTAQTDRGNGLLFIDGGDLTITGDLAYQVLNLNYLRNLASFGVIVTKNAAGTAGGNIIIKPNVQTIVGAYFAENTISTGSLCPGSTASCDVPLNIFGMMAAHKFNLERNFRDPNRAAEVVSFDGRSVANPPPGMGDVTKSLPTSNDAF